MIGVIPMHESDSGIVNIFIFNPDFNDKYWKKYHFYSNLRIK